MSLPSIRRRLLLSLIATVGAVALIAGAMSYRIGLQEAGELFDAKLAHSARVLMSLVDASLRDLDRADSAEPLQVRVWHGAPGAGAREHDVAFSDGHAYETKLAFQVRRGDGRLLLRSDSGPAQVALGPLRPGYAEREIDGERWRSFTLRSPNGYWYQAGEISDIRAEIAREIAFGTVLPLLLGLPLLAALAWWSVGYALRDLRRVSAEIGDREPARMSPLPLARAPLEIRPLLEAINHLLQRLDHALARERRFVADAAHELRTPIAALRVHADNLRSAPDAEEAAQSQAQLERGVARLERLVAQLLSLNRIEHRRLTPVGDARSLLDLASLTAQQCEALRPLAMLRGIALEYVPPSATLPQSAGLLQGDGPALESLVRNLIDNALRYSPDGGRVRVTLESAADALRLWVEDSGPGIPAEARERVFARFHREIGGGGDGSGLGLSIVREALELHGGRIALDGSPSLGGLRVEISLPRAAA